MRFILRCVAFSLTISASLFLFAQNRTALRITQAIDDRETTVLRGNVHPQVQHAVDQGRMDGATQLHGVSLVFKRTPEQEAAVEKLLEQQQDPASPNYHKWLTPEQYADRFGLSQADLDKVAAWLKSEGFTVDRVARGRTQLWFSGSVTQIETVFRTEMHHYQLKGESHFAMAVEPSIPSAIAGVVLGLHNVSSFRPKSRVKANPHFTSNSSGIHHIVPDDIATIYRLNSLYGNGFDGNGQSIAIVGQSAINTSDIDSFRSAAGLPARTSSNFEQVVVPNSGTSTAVSGDIGESSLDLEWAQGVARGATEIFVYVGNSSNFTVFDAFTYAIDNNVAPIVSSSYGNCEQNLPSSFLQALQQSTQQATTQGQTLTAASGDFGAADCDANSNLPATGGLGVDIPGALPFVTSVGGTEFTGDADAIVTGSCAAATAFWGASCSATSNGSALQYIPETTWNDTTLAAALSASGGGVSTLYPKPSWQTGTGVPADGKRDVPDLAIAASPNHDGYLYCVNDSAIPVGPCVSGFRDQVGNLNIAGGTSFGAPIFAGMMAIWNEAVASSTGQGNINPSLYTHTSDFTDITTGDNKVPCQSGTPNCPTSGTLVIGYQAGAGYDLVTGLGSPKTDALITGSTGYVSSADYVLSRNATVVIASGQSASSTITVSAINGFTGTVQLSCTPPASSSLMGCSITSSVNVGATPATATLSITTTKAHAVSGPVSAANRSVLWLTGFGSLAGVFLVAAPRRKRGFAVAFGVLIFALLAAAVGCGGGSSTPKTPGTPAGTYTIGVSATGTTSHSTNVTVVVQ